MTVPRNVVGMCCIPTTIFGGFPCRLSDSQSAPEASIHPTSGSPGIESAGLDPVATHDPRGMCAGFDPRSGDLAIDKGRSGGRCGLEQKAPHQRYLSSSPLEDEPPVAHDGAVSAEGPGEAQLGAAGAGAGAGVGAAAGAAGLGAAGLGVAGLGGGAAFFAVAFLAAAFLAFFGAAAFDFLAVFFLADFFADFLAFFAAFFADFLEDFLPDFFFAIISFFLLFLLLPLFFFLPLAIVILLLPPINVYRAFQVVRLNRGANRSVQSWPRTACRPIEKLNCVHHRN